MALLARRLVESQVTFVTLNTAPDCRRWDWHASIVKEDREQPGPGGPKVGMEWSGPPLDRALSALITDLSERELCRNVLLIVTGECGRSPKINRAGGHSIDCDSVPPGRALRSESGLLFLSQQSRQNTITHPDMNHHDTHLNAPTSENHPDSRSG